MSKFIKNSSFFLFLIILFVAIFLRTYRIGAVPDGLNPDEAALGYTSFSLLTSGMDEHGKFLPLSLLSFGDGKLPVYPYIGILSVAIMGLNEVSTRLPSVVAGIVGVILIYFIALEIMRKKEYGLLSAFLFAVCPWSVYFSRIAYETNLATTFLLGGLLFFLKYLSNKSRKQFLIISSILFGITIFTYHSYVLFTPLFIAALLLLNRKNIPKKLIVCFVGILSIFVIVSYFSILKGSVYKASSVGVFNSKNVLYNRVEILRGDNSDESILLKKILHTKYSGASYQILQNYINSFSPAFLFDKGGEKLNHNIGTFGNLYLFDVLLLFIGLGAMFWNREKFIPLIVAWLILGPIPSAITEDAPNSARLLIIMPLLVLISAYGVMQIINYFKRKSYLGYFVLIALLSLFVLNFIFFIDAYFIHLNIHRARFWHYGYREAVELSQKYSDYKIVLRGPENFPYIYFLFYEKYDVNNFLKTVEYYPPTTEGFYFVKKFGRYEFPEKIDYEKLQPKTIYIDDTMTGDKNNAILLPSGEPILGYKIKK